MSLNLVMEVEYIINAVERKIITRETANIILRKLLEEEANLTQE